MLLSHLQSSIFYYSALTWGLSMGPERSLLLMRWILVSFVDPGTGALRVLGLVALLTLAVAQAYALRKRTDRRWSTVLVSAWLAGGTLLLIVAVLQASADFSLGLYVVPGAFIALATFTPVTEPSARRRLARLAVPIAVIALAIGAHSAWATWEWVAHPTPTFRDRKAFDRALARDLSRQGDGLVWNAFFDEMCHIHSMETFYSFGKLILPAGPRYFSIHETYWRGFYPGLSPSEIGERVYAATTRWVDVAVVLDTPSRTETIVSVVDTGAGHASRELDEFRDLTSKTDESDPALVEGHVGNDERDAMRSQCLRTAGNTGSTRLRQLT